ncbi:hypothetical protein [Rickettsia asembonensis]|uniref:hypothetical protein n=1 Tax=Rickettsia asembonensis TaxID=1068590 RepID=UPI0023F8FA02|nr:hypothetical protein [Rickettsia asembonensis]WCR56707.1 MAG: hypothetical protein PG979_000764 [Rickettsia asembonensis]
MIVNEEEFKKQPDVINLPECEKSFYYIINVGHYENYDEAMDFIIKNLKNPEELIQAAALQALGILAYRFSNIKEKLILPILFNNLNSKSERILYETKDTLEQITYHIISLRREIYLEYFKNRIDFFTRKILKRYTDKALMYSLSNEEEKKEFILSFCQNSLDYDEALEACRYFLEKKESEQIYKTVFQGLSYIVIRFQKINFDIILPFIKKFIKLDKSCVHIYTGSFLVNMEVLRDKELSRELQEGYFFEKICV